MINQYNMFDDQNPKPASPTSGGVEDIFEGVSAESVPVNLPTSDTQKTKLAPTPTPAPAPRPAPVSAPMFAPSVAPAPSSVPTAPTTMSHKSGSGVGKVIMIILATILIIALSGFLAYKFIMQAPVDTGDTGEVDDTNDTGTETDKEEPQCDDDNPCFGDFVCVNNECVAVPVDETNNIDSDGDGLTDAEEIEAGTDVDVTDTDKDGLGDREEVQVYGTDPLNADTDEDGYLDGQEVSGGYNPNGSGKLLEVPTK